MPENVQTVQAFYDAVARSDMPAILDAFDGDLDFQAPAVLPYGGSYRGPEGFQHYLGNALEHLEKDFRVEPDEFLDAGETVVVLGHLRAKARASRTSFEAPFVHIWTVRDGKLARMRYCIDTATVLRALAGASVPLHSVTSHPRLTRTTTKSTGGLARCGTPGELERSAHVERPRK